MLGKPTIIVSLNSEKCFFFFFQGLRIGNASLSAFGFVGAALEIILILYPFFNWMFCLLSFLGQCLFTKTLAWKKNKYSFHRPSKGLRFCFALSFLWALTLVEAPENVKKRVLCGEFALTCTVIAWCPLLSVSIASPFLEKLFPRRMTQP